MSVRERRVDAAAEEQSNDDILPLLLILIDGRICLRMGYKKGDSELNIRSEYSHNSRQGRIITLD